MSNNEKDAKLQEFQVDDLDWLDEDLSPEEEAWCDGLEKAMQEGRMDEYCRDTLGEYPMGQESHDLTPEEFGAMVDRNESFVGTHADFAKLKLYQQIKADLTEFLRCCPGVVKFSEFAPNPHEKNALIFLDMKPLVTLDKEQAAMLAEVMRKADRVFVSGGESGVRYSFGIEKVWND